MRGQSLFVFLFFLLVSTVETWPLVLHFSTAVGNLGDPLFNAWTLSWVAHQLFHDPLHLFDANIFYPHPTTLAYSEHQVASALLALPVFLFGGTPVAAHNFVLLVSFVLCGFGMFLLVRELTRSAAAGILAGLAFAFSAYRFSQLTHLQMLTAQWIPFALLYLHRAFEKPSWKNFSLFGFFFLLQALSCNYLAVIFSLVVGIWICGMLPARWREVGWRGLGKLATVLLLAAVLLTPFALPYYKLQKANGFTRDWQDLKKYSARSRNYLAVTGKHRLYPESLKKMGGPERHLFLGFMVMGLALLALLFRDKRWNLPRRIYLVILALAYLLSMGPKAKIFGLSLDGQPYRFLYEWFPGFEGMRVPARFAVAVGLALAILAGFGAAGLLARVRRPAAATVLATLLGMAILADGWCVPLRFRHVAEKPPEVDQWLRTQPEIDRLVHLPLYSESSAYKEMNYIYGSTQNWKKMVNGYSGFFPPGYAAMKERLQQFPSKETVDELRRLGVNYCVVHPEQMAEEVWRDLEPRLTRQNNNLELVQQFDSTRVYRIRRETK